MSCGRVIADGCGEDGGVTIGEDSRAGFIHFVGGDDGKNVRARGIGEADGAGDEIDVVSSSSGFSGDGEPHFSGGGVGEISNGIEVFAGRSGGDEDSHGCIFGSRRAMSRGEAFVVVNRRQG